MKGIHYAHLKILSEFPGWGTQVFLGGDATFMIFDLGGQRRKKVGNPCFIDIKSRVDVNILRLSTLIFLTLVPQPVNL